MTNGLKLVAEEMKAYQGIELRWKEVELSFQVQFVKMNYAKEDNQELEVNITNNVTNNKEKVIYLIRQNNNVTIETLSQELNIGIRQCKRIIADLKEAVLLLRVGSNKAGYWQITDKKD